MTFDEYRNRMIGIREDINRLLDDLGVTYSTAPEMLEKVLNVALNGDFFEKKGSGVMTHKIISVSNWLELGAILNGKYEYISFQGVTE